MELYYSLFCLFILFRLNIARSELDKMMLELKEKQDALQEVETKVCLRERERRERGGREGKKGEGIEIHVRREREGEVR